MEELKTSLKEDLTKDFRALMRKALGELKRPKAGLPPPSTMSRELAYGLIGGCTTPADDVLFLAA